MGITYTYNGVLSKWTADIVYDMIARYPWVIEVSRKTMTSEKFQSFLGLYKDQKYSNRGEGCMGEIETFERDEIPYGTMPRNVKDSSDDIFFIFLETKKVHSKFVELFSDIIVNANPFSATVFSR